MLSISDRFSKTLGLALGMLFSAYLIILMLFHWITDLCPSSDEYTYAQGSRLVTEGFLPVRDFWSHNVDGMLYLFGYWMKLFGFTLFSGRALASLLVLFAAFAVVLQVVRIYRIPAWVALFAMACMNGWFNVGTIVEHHGISDSFSLISFVAFLEWFRNAEPGHPLSLKTNIYFYLMMFSAGIAASARLHYVLIPFLFLLFAVLAGRRVFLKQLLLGAVLLVVTNWMSFAELFSVGLKDFLFMKFFHRTEFAFWEVGAPYTMHTLGITLIDTFLSLALVGFWLHLIYVLPKIIRTWKFHSLTVQGAGYGAIVVLVMLGTVLSSGYYTTISYISGHIPLLIYPFALCYSQLKASAAKWVSIGLLCISFFSALIPAHLRGDWVGFWEANYVLNHQLHILVDSLRGRQKDPQADFDDYETTGAGQLLTEKAVEYLKKIGKEPKQAVVYDPFGSVQFMSGMRALKGYEMSHEYGYHVVRFPLRIDKDYLKKLHVRPMAEISDDLKKQIPDIVVWDGFSFDVYTQVIRQFYQPYFVNSRGYGLYIRRATFKPSLT